MVDLYRILNVLITNEEKSCVFFEIACMFKKKY